jgi:hypothetical protein
MKSMKDSLVMLRLLMMGAFENDNPQKIKTKKNTIKPVHKPSSKRKKA